mmetsp:Transcript_4522/g.18155  ORF Transcript_4522/g.18155 Transcript_4522/m.18155 type:complete len:269 (+) Transcript_4522:2099-2905(+)
MGAPSGVCDSQRRREGGRRQTGGREASHHRGQRCGDEAPFGAAQAAAPRDATETHGEGADLEVAARAASRLHPPACPRVHGRRKAARERHRPRAALPAQQNASSLPDQAEEGPQGRERSHRPRGRQLGHATQLVHVHHWPSARPRQLPGDALDAAARAAARGAGADMREGGRRAGESRAQHAQQASRVHARARRRGPAGRGRRPHRRQRSGHGGAAAEAAGQGRPRWPAERARRRERQRRRPAVADGVLRRVDGGRGSQVLVGAQAPH